MKSRWKLIVNLVTLVLLAVLLVLMRSQLAEAWHNLSRVNWVFLPMVAFWLALNYHGQVKLYQRLFGMFEHRLRYGFLLRVSLELNFVNQLLPSGGVSGFSYFGLRMLGAKVPARQTALVQVLKLLLLFVSFEVLLAVALVLLMEQGHVTELLVGVVAAITVLVALGAGLFVAVIGSPRRLQRVLSRLAAGLNWAARPFRRQLIRAGQVEALAHHLSQDYQTIRGQLDELIPALLWAVYVNMTAVFAILTVYAAFGQWVNPGAVFVAYAVANFAGLVSVLPGGAGIYEALMVGVLAAGGIPAAVSLPVTVLYRVLSTLLQVPAGYWLYHQNLKRTGASPLDQPDEGQA